MRRARVGRASGIFFDPCPTADFLGGCTKRCARAVQLFGRLAVLEPILCDTMVIVPFIGRKNGTLTGHQQCYNDVHGWYRAHIEQLRLWHWGLVRNIWRGGPNELHQSVGILLHFTQFCICRQVRQPPCGPWEHVPPHVWTDKSKSATTQDEAEDEAEMCVLFCQKRSTITVCGECEQHYCAECIHTHTCVTNVVC